MSRSTLQALAFLTVLFLIAAGCSKPEDKFVGVWNGKVALDAETKKQIGNLGPAATQMIAAFEQSVVTLDLKKDKTFSFAVKTPGVGDSADTGTWALATNVITLQARGVASKMPQTITASEDGRTLTAIITGDKKSTITFSR